jgi:hypothetical protein
MQHKPSEAQTMKLSSIITLYMDISEEKHQLTFVSEPVETPRGTRYFRRAYSHGEYKLFEDEFQAFMRLHKIDAFTVVCSSSIHFPKEYGWTAYTIARFVE